MPKTAKDSTIKTLNENWKRALADYQNLLKRIESDKKDLFKISAVAVISKLLPSLDVLEMAAAHSQDQGVQMAVKQFQAALIDAGLQVINPQVSDPFDPALHECVETAALPAGRQDSTIAETVAKGYKIDNYIIRPAKVKVYRKETN